MLGWSPLFQIDPNYQLSVIMPVSVNGDVPCPPCVDAAANYNNNQQSGYAGGYVATVRSEIAEPSQSQNVPCTVNAPMSVHRIARPILGAASNLCLPPQGNLDKAVTVNIPSDSVSGRCVMSTPMMVDVYPQPARPPSNSDTVPNGRHWSPALDSPNCPRPAVVLPPPSSSPTMMQQLLPGDPVTVNPPHQFIAPPYCSVSPSAVPSTAVPSGPMTSSNVAAESQVPAAILCTAGCCHCGHCQLTAPPVGAYAYAYPPFVIPSAAPFLHSFGYAISGVPFPPPSLPRVSYSGTYTQSGDVMYNQPVFTFMHQQFQRPPPPPPSAQAPVPPPQPSTTGRGLPPKPSPPVVTVPFNPMLPPPPPAAHASGRRSVTKNSSCFNCGLIGHQASVCPEPFISSSAHTGLSALLPRCLSIVYLCSTVNSLSLNSWFHKTATDGFHAKQKSLLLTTARIVGKENAARNFLCILPHMYYVVLCAQLFLIPTFLGRSVENFHVKLKFKSNVLDITVEFQLQVINFLCKT